ncbi:unnamed protein product, partial [Nesidiocoris tenuis]
ELWRNMITEERRTWKSMDRKPRRYTMSAKSNPSSPCITAMQMAFLLLRLEMV